MKRKILKTFIILLLPLMFTACQQNEEIGPEDVFAEYVELWNEQNFKEMYGMLSDESKAEVTEEEFVGRYEKIYNDVQVTDLQVEFEKSEEEIDPEEEGTVSFPFKVSMNTIAGPIAFEEEAELVKVVDEEEETNWYIHWHTGFIFKGLRPEDKVGIKTEEPIRGEILDRNGEGLAINGEAKEVGLVPGKMTGDQEEIKANLAEVLQIPVERIEQALNASWVQPDHFVPIKRIPKHRNDIIEKVLEIPGVLVNTVKSREYPLGGATTHLIGYVDEVTAEDIENNEGYSPGDVIGKKGLEQVFEKQLRGEPGVQIYFEMPDGTRVPFAEKQVKHGEDIQLTIDSEMQEALYARFEGREGTAIALHPKTGETLALTSSPAYDPNEYMFMSPEQRQEYWEEPKEPTVNRFTYPHTPGSVMKVFTAAIGLETGVITPELTREIDDYHWQKDSSWGGYHITRVTNLPQVNLRDALVRSDNIYFAQTALEIGPDQFIAGLENFGFGEEIPYSYPLTPSKISNSGELDQEILLADTAYGQGEVQTNIVHLASGYTTFINGGNMMKPVLLSSEPTSQIWKEGIISEQTAAVIADNLRLVVADPNGTGRAANMEDIPLAGKTGTAEISKAAQGEKGIENGWFVAYNTDTEDLLVAMMMEEIQDESGVVVNAVRQFFEEIK